MRLFGWWLGQNGLEVINNVRWGTEETWSYCFEGIPSNSIVAVGTVASGLRRLVNRSLFESGIREMIRVLNPHTIIVYGSAHYAIFEELESRGIQIIVFPSRTDKAFSGRRRNE